MRSYPDNDKEMQEALDDLECDPALIELLKENPDYMHWGPHEDYQAITDHYHPGSSRTYASWGAFRSNFRLGYHPMLVDDRTGGEVVNWYFSLHRDGKPCNACDQSGMNPETKRLYDNWYAHRSESGEGWSSSLTQDEVDKLVQEGRLWEFVRVSSCNQLNQLVAEGRLSPEEALRRWEAREKKHDYEREDDDGNPLGETFNNTVMWRDSVPAEEVNEKARSGRGILHDAINCWICVRHRAERLGVWGLCSHCEGKGHFTTSPVRIQLVLWMINPATGQSYGVEIDAVKFEEIGEVRDFLHTVRGRLDRRLNVDDLRVAPIPTYVGYAQEQTQQDGIVVPATLDGESRGWIARTCAALSDKEGWNSEIRYPSWSRMRAPCNWRGELLDPASPKFMSATPSWELDEYNELAWFRFDLDAVGETVLHLWMMHPRKGCTRRVTIKRVTLAEVPSIKDWLMEARRRTNLRFAKLA